MNICVRIEVCYVKFILDSRVADSANIFGPAYIALYPLYCP